VGAAAGLALQALLRDSLGEAAEARYTIRGPWTDPQIEPVDNFSDTPDSLNGEDESGTESAVPESPDNTNDSNDFNKQDSTGENING
jgi:hypothetical protein